MMTCHTATSPMLDTPLCLPAESSPLSHIMLSNAPPQELSVLTESVRATLTEQGALQVLHLASITLFFAPLALTAHARRPWCTEHTGAAARVRVRRDHCQGEGAIGAEPRNDTRQSTRARAHRRLSPLP